MRRERGYPGQTQRLHGRPRGTPWRRAAPGNAYSWRFTLLRRLHGLVLRDLLVGGVEAVAPYLRLAIRVGVVLVVLGIVGVDQALPVHEHVAELGFKAVVIRHPDRAPPGRRLPFLAILRDILVGGVVTRHVPCERFGLRPMAGRRVEGIVGEDQAPIPVRLPVPSREVVGDPDGSPVHCPAPCSRFSWSSRSITRRRSTVAGGVVSRLAISSSSRALAAGSRTA